MITEIDAGHIIYDDLSAMQMERRLKGHLQRGYLNGDEVMIGESVPEDGIIVIIPKKVSADKTYFNDCTIVVNILLKDIASESNPMLNDKLKQAFELLSSDKVGQKGDDWYRYNVRSHGIEEEKNLHCHYANLIIDFQILNIRR